MQTPPPIPRKHPPDLSPVPGEKNAAWWCWILIAFSLIPFHWYIPSQREQVDVPEEEAGDHGQSDLALLKMQGQIVIASSRLDPGAAAKTLDDLAKSVRGDRSVAALALLESFLQPASPRAGETLKRFSENVPDDLAEATEEALESGVAAEGREQLRTHLGWFADLARGPDRSAPPLDQSIRARSFLVLGFMGLILSGVVIGILSGATLLFIHLRRLKTGVSVNAFDPSRRPAAVLLECFSLYLAIMTLGALGGAFLHPSLSFASYGAAVILPLLWPRFRGIAWKDLRLSLGLHRGQGWWQEIGAGFVGYLGVLAIASIGIFLTLMLSLLGGFFESLGRAGEGAVSPVGPEAHPIVGWIYGGSLWTRLACLALAAGFAPLFEELFFRGALQRYLRGRFRFLPAALIGGLIFAALHPQGFYAIPALAGMGIGFSVLREWRDSLIAPMVAHAINNGVLVGMLWWVL